MAYRKRKGSDTWHWHPDCSNWPKSGYEQLNSKPKSGELCNQCKAKDKQSKK
jgi:hypothetical protein